MIRQNVWLYSLWWNRDISIIIITLCHVCSSSPGRNLSGRNPSLWLASLFFFSPGRIIGFAQALPIPPSPFRPSKEMVGEEGRVVEPWQVVDGKERRAALEDAEASPHPTPGRRACRLAPMMLKPVVVVPMIAQTIFSMRRTDRTTRSGVSGGKILLMSELLHHLRRCASGTFSKFRW